MASTTAAPMLYTEATCFPYEVTIAKSFWDADPVAAGVAFFLGTLLGVGVAMFCAWLCLRDLRRSKNKEQNLIVEAEYGHVQKSSYKGVTFIDKNSRVAPSPEPEPDMKTSMKRKKSSKRRRPGTGKADDPNIPIALVSIGEEVHARGTRATSKGLADALLLNNGAAMDAELSNQDLDSITALDNDLRGENINTMVQMLRVLLQQQMQKGTVKEEDLKDLMKTVQTDVASVITTANREREEQEQELKKKYEKDPDKLDVELEKLHGKQMSRINTLLGETTEKIRKDIGRNSAMTEEEIDSMMAELNYNLSESERRLAEQRTKQSLALEERLARRKNLAEMHRYSKEHQETDIQVRNEVHERSLGELVDDGKMLQRQKDDLLEAYSEDQNKIYRQHQEELQKQQLHLAEKLAANRQKKMAALSERQEEEREDFLRQADANTNTESVRESFHRLLDQQRQDKADQQEDLDNEEAEHFTSLIKNEEKQLKEELNQTEERLFDSLTSRADLSQGDAEKLMTIHQAEMSEYEKSKKSEKKRMQAKMQEKLEQRRQRAEEETMLIQAEQQSLTEQQTNTIQKVLHSQVEMDSDAKEKILAEHEQQMTKVNNQLQMSKLRQQKALEQRLNKRRARVANMKDEQEQLRKDAKENKEKDKEKMAEQLEKQIQQEEKKLENMRKTEVADLRRTLADETAEALKEQEKQLSLLIARLEVGQARRKALIERQDKTIKELESKMVDKVGDVKPTVQADRKVDVIISQHTKEVEVLEDKMNEARDRQEAILQERLQAKKIKRERQMERELESEAQDEWEDQKKRGAGLATSILGGMIQEQRHKMAMEQLSREMQLEMQKQREELNKELELEMKAELEEQKKSFLAQLAAISNMSKEEVSEVVENAVTDAGGSEKEARKLAKEMKIEVKRAKTELGGGDRDYSPEMRRAKSDMYEDEQPLYDNRRPKSGRRPLPKAGFVDEGY